MILSFNAIIMKKIRFGVIGTNFIVDWVIASARKDPRFNLVAVCSRNREHGKAFAARHNIPHVFTSVEEMVCGNIVDAVYVASPNYAHADQSIICMRYGKHVLCEKPLASNAEEVERMIAVSKQYGVALMEGMMTTLTPAFSAILANVDRIGVIRRYFSSYCQYSSRYDRFKGGELVNAFNPKLSNSAIMDIGIYTIYPMVVLFGRPNQVVATGLKLHTGADAQGSVIFRYDNMDAVAIYSKIADSQLPSEIDGEFGLITIDNIHDIKNVNLSLRIGGAIGGQNAVRTSENITPTQSCDGYYYEIGHFIDMIENGELESIINSHRNSLVTIQILDEVRRQIGIKFPADESSVF